jgi:hypothetical protein
MKRYILLALVLSLALGATALRSHNAGTATDYDLPEF